MIIPPPPQIRLSETQKRLLWQLRVGGPAPRIHLAEALGMGNGAMTRLSREMMTLGLIDEQAQSTTLMRGRPTVPLAVSGDGGYAAGATAHPGWIEIVLVDFAGTQLVRDSIAFDSPDPHAFAMVVDQRLRLLTSGPAFLRRRFLGMGIAVAGYALADDRRWSVDWLSGWRDIPLTTFFTDAFQLPIWIENEATAAALAEYYEDGIFGRYRSILVFCLSHGVGAGLVADRDLLRGDHDNAGEIGRLFPGPGPRPSGVDLLRTLRDAGVEIQSLSALDGIIDTHRALFDAWMDRVARQLGAALLAGVAWLDPGAVIMSGSLPNAVLAGLVARLTDWDVSHYRGPMPTLHVSRMGSAAVAVGAALIPIHAITAPEIEHR